MGTPSVMGREWRVVRLGYRPAYDGLRALAVFLVFCDHAGTRLRGAFVGVDIFFVLSGFLITSLLLEEWSATGRVDCAAFYGRRARRLLPALFLVLAFVGVLYQLKPSTNGGWSFGATALSVVFYAGNWVAAAAGANTLGALKHTWSLGIEEQFYLVWPLVLIVSLRRRWRPRRLIVFVSGAAVVSAVLRAAVFLEPWGPHGTAAYLRSDTHADGLALGCLIGIAGSTVAGREFLRHLTGPVLVVLAAGLYIAIAAFTMRWTDRTTYLGGLAGVNVAAAIVVSHLLLAERSLVRSVLELRPLVWFGRRSYGFYLFHLPILLALSSPTVSLAYWPWFAVCFGTSLFAAATSYALVESYFLRRRRYASPLQTREPVDLEPETPPEPARRVEDPASLRHDEAAVDAKPLPSGFEFRWDALPRTVMAGYDREATELLFEQVNARYRQLFEDRQGLRDEVAGLRDELSSLRGELQMLREDSQAAHERTLDLERKLSERDAELEGLRRANTLAEERLTSYRTEFAIHQRRERVVTEMLEAAKKQADQIKADARAEAGRALEKARRRREADVRRSAVERERMRAERERVDRAALELRQRLSEVLVSALRTLEGDGADPFPATNGSGAGAPNGGQAGDAISHPSVQELLEGLAAREPS